MTAPTGRNAMPDEIEVVHVDGIPYVKQINSEEPMGTALYVDLDDQPCSVERWVDLTLGSLESKILCRDVARDFIVSTIWVGLNFDAHVWETATILERDDLTVRRAIGNNRPDAMVNHEYWMQQMLNEGNLK